jgi:hypothetical protein
VQTAVASDICLIARGKDAVRLYAELIVTEAFDMHETQTDDTATDETQTGNTPTDQTESAAGPVSEATPTIDGLVAQWRVELDGQTSIPATNVQDRLLDLWGALPENQARAEIERWLTETLARQLYRVDDITARLDSVLADN